MIPQSAPSATQQSGGIADASSMIPVFVVSLRRAPDRRKRICDHLDDIGVQYRLIDAVDGQALSAEERKRVTAPGVQIHPGAIGCYLSHIAIYRAMIEENVPAALVLEDDARLNPRFLAVLRHGCESLQWDYCFLDSDDHNDRGPIFYDGDDAVPIAPGLRAHRLSAGPQTTHAYMITLHAARRRLDHALPIRKAIDRYDHLPYSITFRAIVAPKMAWVSEDSLTSFTSSKLQSADSLRFAFLRRSPFFYRVRDFLWLKDLRLRREIAPLVARGILPADGRWVPLPSGREIVVSGKNQSPS